MVMPGTATRRTISAGRSPSAPRSTPRFVIAELIFGYAANSLALISDAVHNLSDVIALLLAWGAAWLSQKQPTQRHTYGYRRASILAALFNAGLLLVAVGGIVVEAVNRLAEPAPVAG